MSKLILKGKKVILRPLSLKDAPNFCRWLADREITKFLSWYEKKAPSLKEEREWLRSKQRGKEDFILSIQTIDGQHIGSVGLHHIDYFSKNAEYGIMIGDQRHLGQGYGTEVGKLMVDYGFKKLKLHRIFLQVIAYNIRGIKSYKKIGFRIEGRSRQHIWRDGYWHDKVWMGMLRQDWIKKNIK